MYLAISSVYVSSSRLYRSHNHPSRRPLALPGVLPSGFEATGSGGDQRARTAGVVGTRRGPGAAGRRGPGARRGGAGQPAPPRLRRFGSRGGAKLPRPPLASGGRDNGPPGLGPPGLRERYNPHYYAAFVIDPDGHNIEAVFQGP